MRGAQLPALSEPSPPPLRSSISSAVVTLEPRGSGTRHVARALHRDPAVKSL